MTLTIELTQEQETRLRERAAQSGQEPAEYARSLIDRGLRSPSLDEILAPLRREFAESGMSEPELDSLIESARNAIYGMRPSRTAG